MKLKMIRSVAELRENVDHWDDLWSRSTISMPLAQAEMIAQWSEQFASHFRFFALVAEVDGVFVGAIPVVGTRKAKFIAAGMNPSNGWSQAGQLLMDSNHDMTQIADVLISGLQQLPFHVLWFDEIRFEQPEWIAFRQALMERKIPSQWLKRHSTGILPLDKPFDELSAGWKKKEIHKIQRRIKKHLEPEKTVFTFTDQPEEVLRLLPECFALENKGWKGERGSILQRNMSDFFLRQATFLSQRKQLRLYTLCREEKLIAFQYALVGKSTLFSQKIAYDPDFSTMSPSQSLRYMQIEQLCHEKAIGRIDLLGKIQPFQQCWNPQETATGQIVVPLSNLIGKSFFFLYDTIMPWWRRRKLNSD